MDARSVARKPGSWAGLPAVRSVEFTDVPFSLLWWRRDARFACCGKAGWDARVACGKAGLDARLACRAALQTSPRCLPGAALSTGRRRAAPQASAAASLARPSRGARRPVAEEASLYNPGMEANAKPQPRGPWTTEE